MEFYPRAITETLEQCVGKTVKIVGMVSNVTTTSLEMVCSNDNQDKVLVKFPENTFGTDGEESVFVEVTGMVQKQGDRFAIEQITETDIINLSLDPEFNADAYLAVMVAM